jgi:hypothetical protein
VKDENERLRETITQLEEDLRAQCKAQTLDDELNNQSLNLGGHHNNNNTLLNALGNDLSVIQQANDVSTI